MTLRRLAVPVGGAVLALGLLADRGPARRVTFPGPPGRIAYTLPTGLWVANPDGSGRQNVSPLRVSDPAWAPDGNRIAVSYHDVAAGGIHVVAAAGGAATRITQQPNDFDPAWSPDGQRIAFVRNENRFDRLFVMNADGSGVRVLTDANVHVQDPEWSPDGSRFVFSNGGDIFLVNVDGTGFRQLTGRGTPGELRGGRWPSWSPDGSTIVFSAVDSIRLIQGDGSGNRELVPRLREVWELSWSPDGTRIAFINDPGDNPTLQEELFVMNADGSGQMRPGVDTETTLDWGIAAPVPPPVAGVSVNIAPVSGVVRVRLRGRRAFVDLSALRQVPVGSELDVTRGRVRLTSAAGARRTQNGVFYQGRAVVRQRRARAPVTTLELSSPLTCPRRSSSSSGGAPRPRVRRLWGNARGRFRTRGRFSSATVRGTIWLTEDRCDGTLTRVVRGRVAVEDFGRRRTVIIGAGQSYRARARTASARRSR
jgi:dipeptidyl aminopeptidase/acylaminoacyl peptidase